MPARRDPDRLPDRWDVERAVKKAADLDPIAAHLLMDLLTYMDQGTTVIPYRWTPSLTDLTKDTKWTRRTVTRYLNILEEQGWLVRIRPAKSAAQKHHARTAYTVLIPVGLRTWDSQARGSETPGLGTENAQARGSGNPELETEKPEARDRTGHSPDLPDQPDLSEETAIVVKLLEERTGIRVDAEWAAKTAEMICSRPGIKNRRAYLIRTLVTDPNPQRWLPTPQPPPYNTQEEAS